MLKIIRDMESVCRNKKSCRSCDFGCRYINGIRIDNKYCALEELRKIKDIQVKL